MVYVHDVVKQSDHSDDQHDEPNHNVNQNDYKNVSYKMVAEHYYGTALYSAVDNSCKVVAADPLSLIPL